MIAGELARHRHELFMVEGNVAGLAALHVDARPDDVAVLAGSALPVLLDVKHDRARLARQSEALLRPVDVFEILLSGEPPLPLVGVDREAVEVIGASRQRVRLRLPFGKGAVQVAGDGAPHLRHLQPLIVLRVKKVRGEVLPERALAAERDHGSRSIIFISAARITVSSSQAVFIASAAPAPATRLALSRASRIAAERPSNCASICFSTAGRRVPRGMAALKMARVI